MATFVLIEPDAFAQRFAGLKEETSLSRTNMRQGIDNGIYYNVRRPVRGIQIKDDTYATIRVMTAQGAEIMLFDAAALNDGSGIGKGAVNSNFLIQSISESRVEKQQVVLTFGEPYIYFFGEQPRMLNVSGILLNTEDFSWRAEWWENYDKYLRGTACVRSNTRVYLSWDDIIVEGYIVGSTASETSDERSLVTFQFQMFLTNYQNISTIGDVDAMWDGKNVSLDPSKLSLPSTGDQRSTTLAVRAGNMGGLPDQLSRGEGSKSLLASMRTSKLDAAQTFLMEVNGQIINTLDFVGKFISGRNIRVPIGYTGSQAFDVETQFNVYSIEGVAEIMSNPAQRFKDSRPIELNARASKLVSGYVATLHAAFTSYAKEYGPGHPLSANVDEFVTRSINDPVSYAMEHSKHNLYETQQVNDANRSESVTKIFRDYGIDVDPPKEINLFFKRAMFGIASIGAGMNFAKASSGVRNVVNVSGAIL